jgi:transcription termination factor Rho
VAQDDFFSKSKEDLSAIATAFNLVSADQAASMSQSELAGLLAAEQQKTAGASASDEKPAKKPAAKRTKKAAAKKEDKTEEKKEETASVSEEAKPAEKKEKKTASTKKAASEKKTSTRKKKTSEEKTPIEEIAEAASSEVKEEAAKAPAAETASETKAEAPSKEEKKGRGRKKTKKDAPAEEVKPEAEKETAKDEVKEEKKEEAKETTPSEESSEEKSSSEAKPEGKNQNTPNKNKKQKGRHRSVEIRPANEAPASSESGENGSEENAAEGDAPAEPQKPQIEPIEFVGVLEIVSDGGYGFVRRENYLPSPQDVFVPTNLIRRFGLRMGDQIKGFALPKRGQDKNLALSYITTVNDVEVDKLGRRPHFERLTPIYPDERFRLETGKQELSTRIIDLVSPIGKGQRGMIVSPPKAGKTILLQKIANAITQNSPKTKLIVLLIDERPEEVTDMQRSIKGEVVYSTFDKKPENHTRVTELVLERAMRLVEMGEDVVILLDSMTRLARAYNLTITPTGRTLSGGLDPGSLYGPKRFFGAARNIENGGSLTIVATSLIETGSRMDEVIFEEFKGTGNMEVYLDRKLSEKRIFPAIDINKSGTRREDLLMSQEELDAVWTIRKAFSQMETAPVTETIINLLLRTNSNDHFIRSVKVSFADKEVFDAMRGTGSNGNGNANS